MSGLRGRSTDRRQDAGALDRRLTALAEAVDLAEGRLEEAALQDVRGVLDRAGQRRRLSAEHTVVGFFGATGSGKSSLFNAVAGAELARAAATRPTTSEPLAAVWGVEGSGPLLDWLKVGRRHELEGAPLGRKDARARTGDGGLILLDLPDIDSVTTAHRDIVDRLAGQVDVLVWVLDPQKYADDALHSRFLAPLATHAGVTLVVLNQVDRLAEPDVPAVLDSLRQILARDGLTDPTVLPASALTGQGVPAVRERIGAVASARQAASQRLLADVDAAALALERASTGEPAPPQETPTRPGRRDAAGEVADVGPGQERELGQALAQASGAETVAQAVAASYRHQARARTGWPMVRWIGRLRQDPLRRLHLRRSPEAVDARLHRTSLPERSPAQRAAVDGAVRRFAEAASTGAPPAWRAAIRRAARSHLDTLPDELDQAIATTDLHAERTSWWWHLVNVLQWVALAAAVAGLGWLGALAGAAYLQFQLPPAPTVEGFPVPTLLLAGGLLLGVLLAVLSAPLVRWGAARRARRARRRLQASLGQVASTQVADPVRAEVQRYRRFRQALAVARGTA